MTTFALFVALLGCPEYPVREAADAMLVLYAPDRKAVNAAALASDDPEVRDRLRRHAHRLTIREVDAEARRLGAGYPPADQCGRFMRDPAKYDLTWLKFDDDWQPEFWHDHSVYATFDYGWVGWWYLNTVDQYGRTRAALIMYYGRTGDMTTVQQVIYRGP